VDIREYREDTAYSFRPKSGPVVSWGPELLGHWNLGSLGLRLDTDYYPSLAVVLKRQTRITMVPYENCGKRLRPNKDYLCTSRERRVEILSSMNTPAHNRVERSRFAIDCGVRIIFGETPSIFSPVSARIRHALSARYDRAVEWLRCVHSRH